MGLRGPAPTPTPILEARGSWRAGERDGEPRLPVKAPPCPAWLSKEAKAEWRRQVKQLEKMRVLAEADRAMLAAYCEAWGEFVALAYRIGEMETADAKNGYAIAIAQGLVNAKNKAVDRLQRLAAQFGFSPAARARLKAPEQENASPSGKSRFFRPAAG